MIYRREIDGLRAIAVVPVILFHAGFSAFGGGFVGVDVFFVISGYLITSIIISEIENGRFSIVNFYERRARRILPALFLVVTATFPFAWFWLLPGEMRDYAQSLAAVALFASNFLFWKESGYFDSDAELKPLLHTWSLSVEEQFYVVFPLLILLTWRFGRRFVLLAITVIGVGSLVLAEWHLSRTPDSAFFLLPSRAWELAIGAMAAIYLSGHPDGIRRPVIREVLALAGLAMILASVVVFDHQTPFPGISALLPTLGTALIILFGASTRVAGGILGSRVLVGVGLISYSAYLWHQPLFAFARHRSIVQPSDAMLLLLAVSSLLLAYFSWRFIELPFRDRKRVNKRSVAVFAVVGSSVLFVAGAFGHRTNGNFFRDDYQAATESVEKRIAVNVGLSRDCTASSQPKPECRTSTKPEILLWGDSFAMHLTDALLASNPSAGLVQMTMSVCGPVLGIAPVNHKYPDSWAANCLKHNDSVLHYLESTPSIKYAVLGSPFEQYVGADWRWLKADGTITQDDSEALDSFFATIDVLSSMNITPVVISPPPKSGFNIGTCLAKATFFGDELAVCNFGTNAASLKSRQVGTFLRALERRARVIWLDQVICEGSRCNASIDETFIYRDAGHLSREGSAYLGRRMRLYQMITQGEKPFSTP